MMFAMTVAIVVCVACVAGYLYIGTARYATRKAWKEARKRRQAKWWL